VSAKRGLHLSIGAGPTEETVGVGAWVGVMVMVMIVVWTVAITLALAVVVWDAARGCGESEIVAGAVVPIFNIFNQTLTCRLLGLITPGTKSDPRNLQVSVH
jgi:hypothetical protein